MDVSYSSDEENLNVESSDDLDSEVETFTVLLSMETSQNIRSRQFLNKLILSVVPYSHQISPPLNFRPPRGAKIKGSELGTEIRGGAKIKGNELGTENWGGEN